MLHITACGYVGADPVQSPAGKSTVTSFRLGVRTGEEETTWIDCSIWGRRGDVAMAYIRKGSMITVEGKGKQDSYPDKNGMERQPIKLEVRDFTLPPRQQQEAAPQQRRAPAPAPQRWQKQQDNEELPF